MIGIVYSTLSRNITQIAIRARKKVYKRSVGDDCYGRGELCTNSHAGNAFTFQVGYLQFKGHSKVRMVKREY